MHLTDLLAAREELRSLEVQELVELLDGMSEEVGFSRIGAVDGTNCRLLRVDR
jgi:hypothetical protein